MRIASSHASSSIPVMAAFLVPSKRVVRTDRKPLSYPAMRGPASTIPSRANASVMTEAREPLPIGLRETTSTPIARAARIAVKGSER